MYSHASDVDVLVDTTLRTPAPLDKVKTDVRFGVLASLLTFSIVSASCSAPSLGLAAPADSEATPETRHRVGGLVGRRVLEDSAYDGVEDQPTLGVEYVYEPSEGWLGWEAGVLTSRQDDDVSGTEVESATNELFAGVHATFASGAWRPYVGLGLSVIRTEVETAGNSDNGGSIAGYARAGVGRELGHHWRVGLDLRLLLASHIEFEAGDIDGDYGQLALILSRGF